MRNTEVRYEARNGTDLRLPSLDQSATAAVVTKLAPGAPPVRAHVVAMRPGNMMTCQLEHACIALAGSSIYETVPGEPLAYT